MVQQSVFRRDGYRNPIDHGARLDATVLRFDDVSSHMSVKRSSGDSKPLCSFREAYNITANVDAPSVASIALLFFHGCPTAVFRRVRSIAVNAVNAMRRTWALSHVGKEVDEQGPSLADGNASGTVVLKVGMFWIAAPSAHSVPYRVFAPPGHAMRGSSFHRFCISTATAGSASIGRQISTVNSRLFSARALAKKVLVSALNMAKFKHREFAEGSSNHVGMLTHSQVYGG